MLILGELPAPCVLTPLVPLDEATQLSKFIVGLPFADPFAKNPLLVLLLATLLKTVTVELSFTEIPFALFSVRTLLIVALTAIAPTGLIAIALPALLRIDVSLTLRAAPATVGAKSMPFPGFPPKPKMVQFSTLSLPFWMNLMPLSPFPAPLIDRFRRMTLSDAFGVLMMTPLTKAARILPPIPPPSIVIALVIVTAPKPPGSSTLISPLVAVFEIAPAKVLHGAVRLHGLASSPTPETQVRVA
jgi:hypothetical protein